MQHNSPNTHKADINSNVVRLKAVACIASWVIYLLWVRIVLDYPLQGASLPNFLFESSISKLISFALAFIPWILTLNILYSGCNYFFHNWSEGSLEHNMFMVGECAMQRVRWTCYGVAVINLYFAFSSSNFRNNSVLSLIAVSLVIPFFISNLQSLCRLTFRRWPNHAIAFGNAILYLAVLTMPYEESNLWGVVSIKTESIATLIDNLPASLKGSIIVATVVAVLNESLKDTLSGVINQEPSNVSQRRRRIRRKLLTHWYYKKNSVISSNENIVVNLAIVLTLVYMACLLFSFGMTLSDSNKLPSNEDTLSTTAVGISVVDRQNSVADTDADSSDINGLSLSSYLVILAIIIYVPGIMAHWNISDDRLIQSEYLYLIFQGARLTSDDIQNSTTHWNDYCQVLVHLYSNVSGIASEDHGYHNLSSMLSKLRKHLAQGNDCVDAKFFSDLLCAKGDINAKLLREYPHNEKAEAKNKDAQQAQDLQFATNLLDLLDNHIHEHNCSPDTDLMDYNPLVLIESAGAWFFDGRENDWGQRLGAYNVSAIEGIKLLKMDAMIYILQRETLGHCGLSWLGCNCESKSHICEQKQKVTSNVSNVDMLITKRLELLLSYPCIIIQCFAKRWQYKFDNYLFSDDVSHFYDMVFYQGIYARNIDQISQAVDSVLRHLAELDLGGAFVIDAAEQFLTYREAIQQIESNPDNTALKLHKTRIAQIGKVKDLILQSDEEIAKRKRIEKFAFSKAKESDGAKDNNSEFERNRERTEDVYSNLLEIACCLFTPWKEEIPNGT